MKKCQETFEFYTFEEKNYENIFFSRRVFPENGKTGQNQSKNQVGQYHTIEMSVKVRHVCSKLANTNMLEKNVKGIPPP